jgi:hypothetical protein
MNQEMKRIMEALMLIYGRDLQAATITVLLKDGDTAFRFLSSTFPQVEKEIANQDALLERQTARIVDLQTHIENLEGEK